MPSLGSLDLHDLQRVSEFVNTCRLETPREAYSQLRTNREKASFLVMMKMDPPTLALVRKEFSKHGDGVGLEEFCSIMVAYILEGSNDGGDDGASFSNMSMGPAERKEEFIANMIELFSEVDVNGDGDMEWEEFTKFVVEKASIFRQRFAEDSTAEYRDVSHLLDSHARTLRRHDIAAICVLPKSAELAIIEEHNPAVFINSARTGKSVTKVPLRGVPHAIEYIEDSDVVVAACADMTLNVITLDDPMPSKRHTVTSIWPTPYTQMSLTWMSVQQMLYSGSANGDIYGWNIENRQNVCALKAHSDIVMKVLTLRSLDNVVSASLDTKIGVWDSFTSQLVLQLEGHTRGVFGLSFNPQYRLLASSGFDHDVYIWSPFVNKLVYKLQGHHSSIVGCHCVEDSNELITADASGMFKVWDIRTFQCIQSFGGMGSGSQYGAGAGNGGESLIPGFKSSLSCFTHALSSQCGLQETDARLFAGTKRLYAFDRQLRQHEAVTDASNLVWAGFTQELLTITTVSDQHVVVWDALLGSRKSEYRYLNPVEMTACCFDDRRRKLIVGDVQGNIRVYNPRNGALMKSCPDDIRSKVVGLVYASVTRSFIAGFANGLIRVYSEDQLETCSVIRTFDVLHCHKELHALAYSTSSRVLVSCGADGSEGIKFWDSTKGKCERAVQVCPEGASTLAMCFMEPYALLATADTEGNITILASKGCRWFGLSVITIVNQIPRGSIVENLSSNDNFKPSRPRNPDFGTFDSTARRILALEATESEAPPAENFKPTARRQNSLRSVAQIQHLEPSETDRRISTVQCLSWDEVACALFTGDAAGELRRWNCLDFVMTFVKYGGRGTIEGGMPDYGDNDNSGAVISAEPIDSSITNCRYVNDVEFSQTIKFQWSVKAHENGCDFVNCCPPPASIITYSTDRCLKMWDPSGLLVGVLLQGVAPGEKSICWDMQVDVDDTEKDSREQVQDILEEIEDDGGEDAAIANPFHYQAYQKMSHNELLEDIAGTGFSRSYLRRRIEMSSKNVGLNFSEEVSDKFSQVSDDMSMSTKCLLEAKVFEEGSNSRPGKDSALGEDDRSHASSKFAIRDPLATPPSKAASTLGSVRRDENSRRAQNSDPYLKMMSLGSDSNVPRELRSKATTTRKSYERLLEALQRSSEYAAKPERKPEGKYAVKLLSQLALSGTIDVPAWLTTTEPAPNVDRSNELLRIDPVQFQFQPAMTPPMDSSGSRSLLSPTDDEDEPNELDLELALGMSDAQRSSTPVSASPAVTDDASDFSDLTGVETG